MIVLSTTHACKTSYFVHNVQICLLEYTYSNSDILVIPISSVGAERVFNVGRDVIHYRCGNLKGKTIRNVRIVKDQSKGRLMGEQVEEYIIRVGPYDGDVEASSVDDRIVRGAGFLSNGL